MVPVAPELEEDEVADVEPVAPVDPPRPTGACVSVEFAATVTVIADAPVPITTTEDCVGIDKVPPATERVPLVVDVEPLDVTVAVEVGVVLLLPLPPPPAIGPTDTPAVFPFWTMTLYTERGVVPLLPLYTILILCWPAEITPVVKNI